MEKITVIFKDGVMKEFELVKNSFTHGVYQNIGSMLILKIVRDMKLIDKTAEENDNETLISRIAKYVLGNRSKIDSVSWILTDPNFSMTKSLPIIDESFISHNFSMVSRDYSNGEEELVIQTSVIG